MDPIHQAFLDQAAAHEELVQQYFRNEERSRKMAEALSEIKYPKEFRTKEN